MVVERELRELVKPWAAKLGGVIFELAGFGMPGLVGVRLDAMVQAASLRTRPTRSGRWRIPLLKPSLGLIVRIRRQVARGNGERQQLGGGQVAPTAGVCRRRVRELPRSVVSLAATFSAHVIAVPSIVDARGESDGDADHPPPGDVEASSRGQVRLFVLQPYQMVEDLRTEHEVGNPAAVFDGDIDDFIEAGIRWRRSAESADA